MSGSLWVWRDCGDGGDCGCGVTVRVGGLLRRRGPPPAPCTVHRPLQEQKQQQPQQWPLGHSWFASGRDPQQHGTTSDLGSVHSTRCGPGLLAPAFGQKQAALAVTLDASTTHRSHMTSGWARSCLHVSHALSAQASSMEAGHSPTQGHAALVCGVSTTGDSKSNLVLVMGAHQ